MTPRAPEIGVRIPQYGTTWSQVRAFARRAEALGFAGLWANDHLRSPGRRKEEPAFDALTTLAALAPLTRRPRLGVAVLSASHRPPALAAKMATVLDVVSGGRLTVGLGTGSDRGEHDAYGLPFGSPAERAEGLRTALRTMRAMFRAPDGADLEGVLAGAANRPEPSQPGGPPIWLAAHRPRLLRLAGREADGIVAAFCGPGEVSRRLAVAGEAREGGGPLSCALYTYALAAPSEAEAISWLRPEAEWLGGTPAGLLRWLRGTGIVGTPADVRGALAAHAAAGVTDAVLVLPSRVPPEALDALAEAALPPRPSEPARPAPIRAPGVRPEANLTHLLVDAPAAAGHADREAAVDDDGSWTFAELSEAAARAAGALRSAGARRGDRVAIALPDGRQWLAAFLGAARMGAVPVPLDPAGDPEGLAGVVADCEPALVVAEPAAAPSGAAALDPAELAHGAPAPVAAVHPDDLAYLIYSSGSTGRPKGAMHAHRDMRTGIETYGRGVLGLGPGDRCHSVARLFTSLGFGNGFFRVLGCAATAVLSARRPTPRAVLGAVERNGVTVLTAVPTFWSQLARHIERHPEAASALGPVRIAVSSGDALAAPVAERLRRSAGVEPVEGLGCSECSNVVISTRPGEHRPGVLGRAVPGVDIRLADEEGAPVAPGTPGRLWIRSPSNTSGYWRRAEETRDLVHGPWLRMGDVLVEEGGVYRHVGRADDLFKVDARWVSPAEVEACILGDPDVAEAAVVGRRGEDGLVRAAAVVVPGPGAGGDGLDERLRRRVAHAIGTHAAPATVTLAESLPRGPSGKVDRRALREAR